MRVPLIITLICFAARLASAANAPEFDTKGYCKKTNDIVDSRFNKGYDNCINSEKKAQELLPSLIDAISPEDLDICINKASKNKLGSYVELAVCIELNPNFGWGKDTSSASANLSKHAGAVKPVSQTVVSPVDSITLGKAGPQIQASKFHFDHNLDVGAVDSDVRELQIYLNANGFSVADDGPGSPGHEVDVFDANTRIALGKFQAAHATQILLPFGITKATGRFGNATRKYINETQSAQARNP
jgi:putative peptidoglycan binding protein